MFQRLAESFGYLQIIHSVQNDPQVAQEQNVSGELL